MKKLPIFFFLVGSFVLWIGLNFEGCSSSPSAPVTVTQVVPTATPVCSSPTSRGVSSTAGLSYGDGVGYIISSPITISTGTTATSISLYVGSGPVTGQIRYAIYGDNGGVPGNLIFETDPQNLAASSWNTASLSNVYLPASGATVYWLSFQGSNGFQGGYGASGAEMYLSYSWGVFPDSMPVGTSSVGANAVYITTCP